MSQVRYHDTVKVLQAWDRQANAPFDRSDWFRLLAGPGGLQPVVVTTDAAAFPMMRGPHGLEALANWYGFRWQPLGDQHDWPVIAEALRKDGHSRIDLGGLPGEHHIAAILAASFRAAGYAVFLSISDRNHILPVGKRDWQAILAGRPGRLRTTIKRKAPKLNVAIHEEYDDDIWRTFEEIYTGSWKPAEGSPDMLRAFAQMEGKAGRLRLGIACRDDRPVAAQLWTVEGRTAWIHKLAHLPEADALSPGTILTAALMQRVIDFDHVDLIDFGTGDDGYKRHWMEAERPRYTLTALDPRTPRNWPALARNAARRLASRPAYD